MNIAPTSASSENPAQGKLVVFEPREGEPGDVWSREHGTLSLPDGWAFLEPGNTFVTRHVKKGPHWVLMGKHSRRGGYTPTLGVYAPGATIAEARRLEQATTEQRERKRKKSQIQRAAKEQKYRQNFEKACFDFLDFVHEHAELAKQIAREATDQACQVSSGRVGRTAKLELTKKVELAVRAYLRHNHTDYEEWLSYGTDEEEHRGLKAGAAVLACRSSKARFSLVSPQNTS
ncbi:MAG: DUF2293 domain-containing protein [Nitrospirae bacterium]|nr:MAG: DUF2293 domain-containing protein [Nitrospirota bacterium]